MPPSIVGILFTYAAIRASTLLFNDFSLSNVHLRKYWNYKFKLVVNGRASRWHQKIFSSSQVWVWTFSRTSWRSCYVSPAWFFSASPSRCAHPSHTMTVYSVIQVLRLLRHKNVFKFEESLNLIQNIWKQTFRMSALMWGVRCGCRESFTRSRITSLQRCSPTCTFTC